MWHTKNLTRMRKNQNIKFWSECENNPNIRQCSNYLPNPQYQQRRDLSTWEESTCMKLKSTYLDAWNECFFIICGKIWPRPPCKKINLFWPHIQLKYVALVPGTWVVSIFSIFAQRQRINLLLDQLMLVKLNVLEKTWTPRIPTQNLYHKCSIFLRERGGGRRSLED